MNGREHNLAAYIGDMTLELAEMARTGGFELLAYVLEMAVLEAEAASERTDGVQRRPM